MKCQISWLIDGLYYHVCVFVTDPQFYPARQSIRLDPSEYFPHS